MEVGFFDLDFSRRHVGVYEFTPELCQEILKHRNHGNRKIVAQHVRYLAKLMVSGEWNPEHYDRIIFDTCGDLITGQHRLSAVCMAGFPVRIGVEFGVSPDIRQFRDSGISQSLKDRFFVSDMPFAERDLVAIFNMHLRIPTVANKAVRWSVTRATPRELTEFYLTYKNNLDAVCSVFPWKTKGFTTAVCYGIFALHTHYPGATIEFLTDLKNVTTDNKHAKRLMDHLLRFIAYGGSAKVEIAEKTYCQGWRYAKGMPDGSISRKQITLSGAA